MASIVRQPRAWIDIGGGPMPVVSATWTRKAVRAADTFSATLAVDTTAKFGFGYAELADLPQTQASITAATQFGGGDLTTVVSGVVDKPEIDWDNQKVTLSGRDMSSSLIDNRRNQNFLNQTPGQIVSTIAQDRGLTAAVVDVGDFAGKVFTDTSYLALLKSDYEIVSELAERLGYRWYVDGSTLYFQPKEQLTGTYDFVYVPATAASFATGNCWALKTWRNMTAARPTTVTVKSWNHKDKRLYTGTASAGGIGSDIVAEYHHNGKTQDQVQQLAQSRLDNAIRHDCNASWTAVGDLNLDVQQKANLTGTGTIYDQSYDLDAVTFRIGWDQFFEMDLVSKTAAAGRT